MDGARRHLKPGKLRKRSEFLFVRGGYCSVQKTLLIQMRANPEHTSIRVGFTATRKIGNATTRNRAKRRLRETARALVPGFGLAGHDYVFIARADTPGCHYQDLLDDTKKALITLARQSRASA